MMEAMKERIEADLDKFEAFVLKYSTCPSKAKQGKVLTYCAY
jgi:parvulin-like peptidyl-prolyl isomerase